MRGETLSADGSAREISGATSRVSPAAVRAVIYARVSSLAQRDQQTIASQLETLPKFVSFRGWNLVRPAESYVDDGRTAKAGFLTERLGFTRLLRDAERSPREAAQTTAIRGPRVDLQDLNFAPSHWRLNEMR